MYHYNISKTVALLDENEVKIDEKTMEIESGIRDGNDDNT